MVHKEETRHIPEDKLVTMREAQAKCDHEWQGPKLDPEIKLVPKYEDALRVSNHMPASRFVERQTPRWSRRCKKCGKIEYTKKQIAVKFEPKFD